MRAEEDGITNEDDLDDDMGVLLLNFIADFWDMKTQYKLQKESGRGRREAPSRPSCSVLFKYLPEAADVVMGHNTWHEYRAMSFRQVTKPTFSRRKYALERKVHFRVCHTTSFNKTSRGS